MDSINFSFIILVLLVLTFIFNVLIYVKVKKDCNDKEKFDDKCPAENPANCVDFVSNFYSKHMDLRPVPFDDDEGTPFSHRPCDSWCNKLNLNSSDRDKCLCSCQGCAPS